MGFEHRNSGALDITAQIREQAQAEARAFIGGDLARAPHAEVTLLATILQDGPDFLALDEARERVSAASFETRAYRLIWQACCAIMDTRRTMSAAAVADWLIARAKGPEDADALSAEVEGLMGVDLAGRREIELHARCVADAAARRTLQLANARIASEAATGDLEELQGELEVAFEATRDAQGVQWRISGAAIFHDAAQRVHANSQRTERHDFRLGFGFDEYISAKHGHYFVVAGPEKAGKTTLALMMAAQLMRSEGALVDIWSVEMGADEIADALICALSGLSRRGLQTGKFSLAPGIPKGEAGERFIQAGQLFERCDLEINATSTASAAAIAARTYVRHAKHRERIAQGVPHIVIVDYIQGLPGPGKGERERIIASSTALRSLCKTKRISGCPPPTVIATAHTNRGRGNLPGKDDLYGSAQPAKDCDACMIIARPGADVQDWQTHVDLSVGLNRRGGTGSWGRTIDMDHMRMSAWAGSTWRERCGRSGGPGQQVPSGKGWQGGESW